MTDGQFAHNGSGLKDTEPLLLSYEYHYVVHSAPLADATSK